MLFIFSFSICISKMTAMWEWLSNVLRCYPTRRFHSPRKRMLSPFCHDFFPSCRVYFSVSPCIPQRFKSIKIVDLLILKLCATWLARCPLSIRFIIGFCWCRLTILSRGSPFLLISTMSNFCYKSEFGLSFSVIRVAQSIVLCIEICTSKSGCTKLKNQ
jgi:hypothetical protein